MKYIDPKTKEVKTIYTKASDTLPIGSIVDYDGEEIPDGWEPAFEDATVYIGPNEPTDGQDIWIKKGKNLFDKNAVVTGWLNEDGSINYESTYRTSTFIKVNPNTTYYKTITNSVRAKFYDKDKNPLTNSYSDLGGSGDFAFTTPENAYYLRVTLTEDYLDTLQIEFGDKPTEYEPYIDKKIYIKNEAGSYDLFVKNRVHIGPYEPEDGEEVWIQKGKNLYNKNGNTTGTYLKMYPTGKTELQSSGYLRSTSNYYSGYSPGQIIRVEKNTNYTISFKIADREVGGTTIIAIGFRNKGNGNFGAIYTQSFGNNVGKHTFTFNTGDNNEILVSLNGVFNTSGANQWIDYDEVQLEKGNEATSFESYIDKKIHIKNENGVYDEFYEKGEIYSTGETVVGRWIDGRPLYRKIIPFGNHSGNSTEIVVAVDIPNLDYVHKMEACGTYYDIYFLPLPYTDVEGKQKCQVFFKGTGYYQIGLNSNIEVKNILVTLYYTKSTDL